MDSRITKAILVLFFLFLGRIAFGEDFSIVDIRRNIPLSDEEPVYKDFYLNGGETQGLKKNQILLVTRKQTIRDASGTHSFGEISIPVGELKILALYKNLSVARFHKLLSRDENPMLEQTGLLVGDIVQPK